MVWYFAFEKFFIRYLEIAWSYSFFSSDTEGIGWSNCKRQADLPLNELISGEPFGVVTFF